MKTIQYVALAAGMALFVSLIHRVGALNILRSVALVGFNFVFLVLVSGFKHVVRTVAWMQCIRESPQRIGFGELFGARLVGEALRFITFTGPLLGEPSKAALIRHRLSLVEGFSSVLVEYFSYAFMSILITILGLGVLFLRFTVPDSVRMVGVIVVVFIAVSTWLCYRLIARRWMGLTRLFGALHRRTGKDWFAARRTGVQQLEENVTSFFSRYRGRWVLILLLDLGAHLLSVFEIYLVLEFLGYGGSFTAALIIESVTKIINAVFFFVPGQVGVYEGGQALLLNILGLGAAAGVTLALVEKIRILFWTAVGLLVLMWYVLNGKTMMETDRAQTELASDKARP